ncbi:histidinol dehydrogenase [Sulfolobus acidocaldarius]|uniref:Histidinol dehydrogenase n=4 Tax=Sulfolobus acidocaldarius TaxID=2285 RepID=HISX_SULAC|nr:histidinol dehydrogenase [Sulfolobus acidocaldarius]Q4J8I8.1 RecName: Full=Histidinol dehydrogenase; Short=HDH [Sulfolobus acidocaldarius DSM 639]AAY80892.1 histidinol dehydrogenase [Sulfolobus acidocaldarius DSM 639]AGE71492.1 bifunctional histidinal dehydrogenase/ histidinol dehydrogenase [Sulfolobus acidocaldarius N8]AGE73765.1 bifunctional histidinal dehydrogenase/ histidinol dehydrogenase [Sulfolobus acidocaldarius Ron12/I]ALU30275.1 histidinol dehydrogenase [Sulfolobus acidocaldarius]
MIKYEIPKSRPNEFSKVLPLVEQILNQVKERGDKALLELEEKYDKAKLDSLVENRIDELASKIPEEYKAAIDRIYDQLVEFHKTTLPYMVGGGYNGIEFGILWRAIEKVGIYVPGGLKSYPSTLLMAAIPARVAGVSEIYVATPPNRIDSVIAYIAKKLKINALYRIGGAQAIAALAYGTESVKKVDKIVGPGNIFVQASKFLVSKDVAIDGIEGPTELVVIADSSADYRHVILDMRAQAEHGSTSYIILVTTSDFLIDKVREELDKEEFTYYIVKVKSIDEAIDVANDIAPEHLSLFVNDPKSYLHKIKNAGAISLGKTPPALIDYAAGPDHILPTNAWSRVRGGLTVYDFLKPISYANSVNPDKELVNMAKLIAEYEGFIYHSKSIGARYE